MERFEEQQQNRKKKRHTAGETNNRNPDDSQAKGEAALSIAFSVDVVNIVLDLVMNDGHLGCGGDLANGIAKAGKACAIEA